MFKRTNYKYDEEDEYRRHWSISIPVGLESENKPIQVLHQCPIAKAYYIYTEGGDRTCRDCGEECPPYIPDQINEWIEIREKYHNDEYCEPEQ